MNPRSTIETSTSPARHSEDWSKLIVESVPTGLIVSEPGGKIVMTNEKARSLFGYSEEEFAKLEIEDLMPERVREVHKRQRTSYNIEPEFRALGTGRELFALRRDGTEFPIEIGLTPLSVPDQNLVLSSIIDITERKAIESKLSDVTARFKFQAEILNNIHDAVFFVDESGIVLDWNEGARRVFGLSSDQAIGKEIAEICADESALLFEELKKKVMEKGVVNDVFQCHHISGRDLFIRARATMMSKNGVTGFVICAADITERKRLESELLKAAEEEQRKIGQELHDDLCSQLAGIGCLTKVLESQLFENLSKEAEMLKQVTEMVAFAGTTARQIAHGLAPVILENRGLTDALSELVAKNQRSYGIEIQLSFGDEESINAIPKDISIQLYRITQEAISNATRHSDAERIELSISCEKQKVELTIRDDGKGMSEDIVSLGMGLVTMRRRAELIGAEFDIHANPGNGTRINCTVLVP